MTPPLIHLLPARPHHPRVPVRQHPLRDGRAKARRQLLRGLLGLLRAADRRDAREPGAEVEVVFAGLRAAEEGAGGGGGEVLGWVSKGVAG